LNGEWVMSCFVSVWVARLAVRRDFRIFRNPARHYQLPRRQYLLGTEALITNERVFFDGHTSITSFDLQTGQFTTHATGFQSRNLYSLCGSRLLTYVCSFHSTTEGGDALEQPLRVLDIESLEELSGTPPAHGHLNYTQLKTNSKGQVIAYNGSDGDGDGRFDIFEQEGDILVYRHSFQSTGDEEYLEPILLLHKSLAYVRWAAHCQKKTTRLVVLQCTIFIREFWSVT
jgi:hypothetical protein